MIREAMAELDALQPGPDDGVRRALDWMNAHGFHLAPADIVRAVRTADVTRSEPSLADLAARIEALETKVRFLSGYSQFPEVPL